VHTSYTHTIYKELFTSTNNAKTLAICSVTASKWEMGSVFYYIYHGIVLRISWYCTTYIMVLYYVYHGIVLRISWYCTTYIIVLYYIYHGIQNIYQKIYRRCNSATLCTVSFLSLYIFWYIQYFKYCSITYIPTLDITIDMISDNSSVSNIALAYIHTECHQVIRYTHCFNEIYALVPVRIYIYLIKAVCISH